MKYKNAAEILPASLLKELQTYINGDILYVPKADSKMEWGSLSGSRLYYQQRNREIRERWNTGVSIDMLANQYGLTSSTIKRIIYRQQKEMSE